MLKAICIAIIVITLVGEVVMLIHDLATKKAKKNSENKK